MTLRAVIPALAITAGALSGLANANGIDPRRHAREDRRASGASGARRAQSWRAPPRELEHLPPLQIYRVPHLLSLVKATTSAGRELSFTATLENWAKGMDYCAVAVPANITQALGTTGPVLVMARVNDSEPFKVSLFPNGGGKHCIRIKAKVRKEAKTETGDVIRLHIRVLDRADVTIPKDLTTALRKGGATAGFASLPPGRKNFLVRRIDEAAKAETRAKRIEEAVKAAHERAAKGADRAK